MPAKDIFHETVKHALIKDGWQITHDPFYLRFGDTDFYIDLAAEPLIAATKHGQPIAVEIKSFLSESPVTEFHNALGKFINYRLVLAQKEPHYTLYLAVPLDTYNTFFQRQFTQLVIQQCSMKLIVYDTVTQEIVKWIN